MANTASKSDPQGQAAWLLPAKTRWPAQPDGYRRRVDLLLRMEPLRRLTVLRAPGGFGKTCLLADACRRWLDAGHGGNQRVDEIARALGMSELHLEAHLEAIRHKTGAGEGEDVLRGNRLRPPPGPAIERRPWRGRRTRPRQ